MKALLLTLLSVFAFSATAPVVTAAPIVEEEPPVVGLLGGRAFGHGGGVIGDFWLALLGDQTAVVRNVETGEDTDAVWMLVEDGPNTYLCVFHSAFMFFGHIHGGPDGHRYAFGPWFCNASGSWGHALLRIYYDGC